MSKIDFSVLEQFCELLGEDGKKEANELVQLYLTDAPEQIDLMRQGLSSDDNEQLKRAAHTLKSSSANVGAMDLQRVCQTLEDQAGNIDTTSLSKQVHHIMHQFEAIKTQLQQWIN